MKTIVEVVENYGEAYTEKSDSYPHLSRHLDESTRITSEKRIYERDISWLEKSRAVIAEISGPSTGTGREIEKAVTRKKLVLCVFHESAYPSLMVTQDPSKYIICQQYSTEGDLRAYLTCFMEAVSHSSMVEEVSRVYHIAAKEVERGSLRMSNISERVDLLAKRSLPMLPTVPMSTELSTSQADFKSLSFMTSFMLKNIVLQSRWDRLGSQRIGRTFVSGEKPQIIRALISAASSGSQYSLSRRGMEYVDHEYPLINLKTLHLQLRKFGLEYNRWALTKNLRAYRTIGLLLPVERITYGSTKFRDEAEIIETVDMQKRLSSSMSRRSVASPVARITRHFRHLSSFLEKYEQKIFVDSLVGARERSWYPRLYEIKSSNEQNIDNVELEEILNYAPVTKLIKDVKQIVRSIWNRSYSSFLPVSPVEAQ